MIDGMKCYECGLLNVCKAYGKLKSFSDEAKVDLGVNLTFDDCNHYISDEDTDVSKDEN